MPAAIRAAATLLAAAAINAGSLHAAQASSPQGIWLDHTGRGAVEIKPCGNKLCGHVVWVKSTSDAKGCGRQIIGDAASAGGNSVHSGWIYSPEKRKRYNVEISPMADGRLKVLGYAGTKLFSRTMYWTPAASDLTRCDANTAIAAPPVPATPSTQPVSPAAKTVEPQIPKQAQAPQVVPAPNVPVTGQARTAAAPQPVSPQATAPSKAEAAVAPQQQDTTQEPDIETAGNGDSDGGDRPRRLARLLDQVLTKSGDGDCKLDLPWVKVKFRCEDN